MSDHPPPPHLRKRSAHLRQPRGAVFNSRPSMALYLAGRPPRPEAAGAWRHGAVAGSQARDGRGSLHFQMGDRCACRYRQRAGRGLARLGGCRAHRHDHCLWRHARPDGAAPANARRRVRQGGDARGAPARLPHLRAYARAVVALPPRAQDRRTDACAPARPRRDRDHRAHGDPATRADHHRSDARNRRADVAVRLALRHGGPDRRLDVYGLHLSCDRMAHRHPSQDERQRQ